MILSNSIQVYSYNRTASIFSDSRFYISSFIDMTHLKPQLKYFDMTISYIKRDTQQKVYNFKITDKLYF